MATRPARADGAATSTGAARMPAVWNGDGNIVEPRLSSDWQRQWSALRGCSTPSCIGHATSVRWGQAHRTEVAWDEGATPANPAAVATQTDINCALSEHKQRNRRNACGSRMPRHRHGTMRCRLAQSIKAISADERRNSADDRAGNLVMLPRETPSLLDLPRCRHKAEPLMTCSACVSVNCGLTALALLTLRDARRAEPNAST